MSNSTPQDHYLGLLAGDNVIRKPTRTARARVLRSIVAFILVVLVIVVSAGAWLPAIGDWLAMPATMDLHRADAIIIHGGNPIRSLYGVDLYRRGLAPELWHTGYAKGEKVLTAMIERGIPRWSFRYQLKSSEPAVPPGSFHFLTSTSTWTDGTQIADTIRARKLHDVIIVTDWWHSRRALCATKQQLQGYDVAISFAPSPSPAGPANWWQNAEMRSDVASELVKLGYYAWAYGMTPWGC